MATIQSGGSPGSRIEAGDTVLQAATHIDTKPIAGRLGAFSKIHGAYSKADGAVKAASAALQARQVQIAEADVDLDIDVNGLASALAGEGLPRTNPFKALKFAAPSAICAMGYEREADVVIKLAAAVIKRPGAGKASIAAAEKARASAKHVQSAVKPITKLEKARSDAMARRAALEQIWETAFAALKRAARYAEDDGAKGLYEALFVRPGPKSAKPAAKKAASKAAPSAGTPSSPP